jgi:hypothetical protein
MVNMAVELKLKLLIGPQLAMKMQLSCTNLCGRLYYGDRLSVEFLGISETCDPSIFWIRRNGLAASIGKSAIIPKINKSSPQLH